MRSSEVDQPDKILTAAIQALPTAIHISLAFSGSLSPISQGGLSFSSNGHCITISFTSAPSPEGGEEPPSGYPRRSRTPPATDAPVAASGHTGSRWRPGSSPDFGAPALPSAAEVASVLGRPCQQYSICQERAQVPISVPPRKLPIDGKRHLCNNAGMNEPETRLELEKAAKLARELSKAVRVQLEDMKKPHPQQAEIDAASVEMLRGQDADLED